MSLVAPMILDKFGSMGIREDVCVGGERLLLPEIILGLEIILCLLCLLCISKHA